MRTGRPSRFGRSNGHTGRAIVVHRRGLARDSTPPPSLGATTPSPTVATHGSPFQAARASTLLVGSPVSGTMTVSPESLCRRQTVTNTLRWTLAPMPNPLTLVGQVQTTPTATTISSAARSPTSPAPTASTSWTCAIRLPRSRRYVRPRPDHAGQAHRLPPWGRRLVVATCSSLNANSFTLLTYSIADPTAPCCWANRRSGEAFLKTCSSLTTEHS